MFGKCKKKVWYYENWIERHTSFSPRRSVKANLRPQRLQRPYFCFFSSSFKCHFLKGNVTKERKIWKKKNVSGAIDKPHFLKGGGRGQKCQNLLSKMGREGEIKSEKLSDIVYGWPLSIFTKGCMTSWPGLVMKENRFFLLVDVKKIQGIFCHSIWLTQHIQTTSGWDYYAFRAIFQFLWLNVSGQSQMSDIFGSHAVLELDEQRSVDWNLKRKPIVSFPWFQS